MCIQIDVGIHKETLCWVYKPGMLGWCIFLFLNPGLFKIVNRTGPRIPSFDLSYFK